MQLDWIMSMRFEAIPLNEQKQDESETITSLFFAFKLIDIPNCSICLTLLRFFFAVYDFFF